MRLRTRPYGDLETNWRLIKSNHWDPFLDQQAKIDEELKLIVLKKNNLIDVYTYIHVDKTAIFLNPYDFLNVLAEIKTALVAEFSKYNLNVILNFSLAMLPKQIRSQISNEVTYYLLKDSNGLLEIQKPFYRLKLAFFKYMPYDDYIDYSGDLALFFYADETLYSATILGRDLDLAFYNCKIDLSFAFSYRQVIVDDGDDRRVIDIEDYFQDYFTSEMASIMIEDIWNGREYNSGSVLLVKEKSKKT